MTGAIAPTNRYGPGETDVVLTNAGGANPRPFATAGLAMNRGVNQHGQLGFDLAYRDTVGYVGQPTGCAANGSAGRIPRSACGAGW
jgi:hypothetical protein